MTSLGLAAATTLTLLLGANMAVAGGDVEAGKSRAATCAGCHGIHGEGAGDNPPLAGMDEAEQIEALQAYKSGERQHVMMQMFAGQLSDQDMADVAAYYASLGDQ
jgi:cytochrome c553